MFFFLLCRASRGNSLQWEKAPRISETWKGTGYLELRGYEAFWCANNMKANPFITCLFFPCSIHNAIFSALCRDMLSPKSAADGSQQQTVGRTEDAEARQSGDSDVCNRRAGGRGARGAFGSVRPPRTRVRDLRLERRLAASRAGARLSGKDQEALFPSKGRARNR